MSIKPIFKRAHDEVWMSFGNEREFGYYPAEWTDEEMEDWFYRQCVQTCRKILRREISIQKRIPYESGWEVSTQEEEN